MKKWGLLNVFYKKKTANMIPQNRCAPLTPLCNYVSTVWKQPWALLHATEHLRLHVQSWSNHLSSWRDSPTHIKKKKKTPLLYLFYRKTISEIKCITAVKRNTVFSLNIVNNNRYIPELNLLSWFISLIVYFNAKSLTSMEFDQLLLMTYFP